jgi:hypothetical protein
MATVTISKRGDGIVNMVTGSFTSDNAAQTLTLGFVPAEVEVINETDVILWYKIDPMVAANCIKQVAAGTTTLDTGSAIVINNDGTVTLSATLVGNAKAIKFIARRG